MLMKKLKTDMCRCSVHDSLFIYVLPVVSWELKLFFVSDTAKFSSLIDQGLKNFRIGGCTLQWMTESLRGGWLEVHDRFHVKLAHKSHLKPEQSLSDLLIQDKAVPGPIQRHWHVLERPRIGSIVKMRCLIAYYVKNRFECKFVFDFVCWI